MKKIMIVLGAVFVLLIGALIALPYLFKDKIIAEVKNAANERLTAKLDFSDVDLSVFRHFPKLAVGLNDLSITGTGPFDGVRLLYCKRLDLAINLRSVLFGDKIAINGLHLNEPDVRVHVLSNGAANYDITKPTPEPAPAAEPDAAGGVIQLEYYAIRNGHIFYDDRSLDMRADLSGVEHSGSGEFTADIYDLVTETTVQALTVDYGGIEYLSKAKADLQATINADMPNMKFTMKDNRLLLNELTVLANGWVALPNDEDITMDLSFSTPQNTFKSLLSLVPGAYTQDFGQVKANGAIQFAGMVKGAYNDSAYPAFRLDFKVDNADFKYPSLPLGVNNINVDAKINSPSSKIDDITVKIPAFSLRIGSNPIEGYFNLSKPESDPTVDTKIKGILNLSELSKAFPMEGVQELSGIIRADILAKASMSQVERQAYEQVTMAGDFSIQNIVYRSSDMPTVRINTLSAALSPQKLDLRSFDARLGKSDLRASGVIDNVLAYFSTNKTMKGNLNFNSTLFDANEWLEEEPAAAAAGPAAGPGKAPADVPAEDEAMFDRWDFTVDGRIGMLKYDVYTITGMALQGHFTPNKMDVSNFALKIGESDLNGSGQVLNAWNYLYDNQTVSGVLNLNSRYFDLNQFMTEEPTAGTSGGGAAPAAAAPAEEGVIPVPENMDMTLNAKFGKVRYTNLDLENLDGQVVVRNSAARLKDCTANVLGGQVAVNGEYNTRDLSKPKFNMDLALQDMGFKTAYQNFVTIKTMAPVAQFIDGKFNTTLSMSGILGQDMMPDFNTLSAAGFLETVNAVISNFKPVAEIGNKLNVEYLKNNLELGNTRNWFEIKDGKVTVKPFDVKVRDIAMRIGGSHGISSDMDYLIVSKVPRKVMGSAANAGLNLLSKEASKYGVNIAQGEFINVQFNLTGTMANPRVAMKVLGSDGESTLKDEAAAAGQALVDQAKDSLRRVAEKEVEKVKEKARETVEQAKDTLTKVATQKVEEAKEKAAEEIKKEAGKVLEKEAADKAGRKVEEVKEKLDKWDPFKKKKDGN
jgi:hypothetical protein